MGASPSSLSAAQKAQISRSMQDKYRQLEESCPNMSPLDILRELSMVYDDDIKKVSNVPVSRQPSSPRMSIMHSLRHSIDDDHQELNLDKVLTSTSKITEDDSANDVSSPPSSPVIARIGRSTSSAELMQKTNDLMESQARISSFISQLKGGEVATHRASGFRVRRLTYAQKTAEEPEKPLPLTSTRTTIYASKEIGVTQEKTPPFPPSILGTFSCHGIEPAHDDVDCEDKDKGNEDDEVDGDFCGIHQKTNQDRGCVVYPYNSSMQEGLFMVLDGHGEQGDRVSEFAMRNVRDHARDCSVNGTVVTSIGQIVHQIEKNLKEEKEEVEEALNKAFIHANTALMTTPIKYMTSGSTCVALYMRGSSYWIANCGDSRAVMARRNGGKLVAVDLSRDHKPDDPQEKARILSWGGFVSPAPEPGLSARVWLDENFTMIGLAMGRSIGDYAVKSVGVVPIPEVTKYEFHPDDDFVIMASDGVWEFISSQEAVDIVQGNIKNGAHYACQELIQTAAVRWQEEEGDYRDDITAIIFTLPLPLEQA